MHISRHLAFHINLQMCLFVEEMLTLPVVYETKVVYTLGLTHTDIAGPPMTTEGSIVDCSLVQSIPNCHVIQVMAPSIHDND